MSEIRFPTQSGSLIHKSRAPGSSFKRRLKLLRFICGRVKLNSSGLTLAECVMSIIILSMVLLPVLSSFYLANSADLRTENVYRAGTLLEGVIAEARHIDEEALSLFSEDEINGIWELLFNLDANDLYDFTLIFEDAESGKTYVFTDNLDLIMPEPASFEFSPSITSSPGDIYDIVVDEYTPQIIIGEDASDTYIAIRVSSEDEIEIVNMGSAGIFTDVYEDCPLVYRGAGFVERHVSYGKPSYLIYGAVYSKSKTQLYAMACGGTY